jgi:hypothetical protein
MRKVGISTLLIGFLFGGSISPILPGNPSWEEASDQEREQRLYFGGGGWGREKLPRGRERARVRIVWDFGGLLEKIWIRGEELALKRLKTLSRNEVSGRIIHQQEL